MKRCTVRCMHQIIKGIKLVGSSLIKREKKNLQMYNFNYSNSIFFFIRFTTLNSIIDLRNALSLSFSLCVCVLFFVFFLQWPKYCHRYWRLSGHIVETNEGLQAAGSSGRNSISAAQSWLLSHSAVTTPQQINQSAGKRSIDTGSM